MLYRLLNDYRLTNYNDIEKWWEIVFSSYLMVSLQSELFNSKKEKIIDKFKEHKWWDNAKGWKNILNNLRLIIQPYIYLSLFLPWLDIFYIPYLETGFNKLISFNNIFKGFKSF